ncbi:MAG: hypothetical protein HFJ60_00010 [Clostridia bacterium]|jgi:hypothetical protein|nr:hypothetical protein [Clostridia bacterium]
MNQIDEKKVIKKAKRKFVKHKFIYVCIKENAYAPYEKSFFHKLISDSKSPLKHKNFILYIHDNYLSIHPNGFVLDTIKVPLDDKLWVELYCVFELDKDVDENFIEATDDEPI